MTARHLVAPPSPARGPILPAGLLWAGLAIAVAGTKPSHALDEKPGEWERLKACEKRICTLILRKEPTGEDLDCVLEKTWPKTTLDGGESKLVKWGFGDARCKVDLKVTRRVLIEALTSPRYQLEVPEHHVACEVESDGVAQPVDVKLAPRIDFKKGRAEKVWINLKEVEGPASIKTTVWTAAKLEDSLGIFHKSMVKSINKFMTRQCPARHGTETEKAAVAKKRKKDKPESVAADAGPAAEREQKPAGVHLDIKAVAPWITKPADPVDKTAPPAPPAPAAKDVVK